MSTPSLPVYLDCNATTPMEPEVKDIILHFMVEEFGNAGSRTHEYGLRAKQAVQRAREQVAAVVGARGDEVTFTSGATEANNLALLGLAPHGERTGRKHIITTAIEHKAVLEPVEELARRGFEVTLLPVTSGGWVDPDSLRRALRKDTLVVSVMHVNNETGVIQPLDEITNVLGGHEAYLHVDAAQGFGKELLLLRSRRIDLISVSGHKIYGPKGVGALVARRRGFQRVPLSPLMFGGGQEKGLRPGTLPVPLIAGLGLASELCVRDERNRTQRNQEMCARARKVLSSADVVFVGDQQRVLPTVMCVAIGAINSEAAMLAIKGVAAISNGSACTSQRYTRSHVLVAMGLSMEVIDRALRITWSHMTSDVPWETILSKIQEAVA